MLNDSATSRHSVSHASTRLISSKLNFAVSKNSEDGWRRERDYTFGISSRNKANLLAQKLCHTRRRTQFHVFYRGFSSYISPQ